MGNSNSKELKKKLTEIEKCYEKSIRVHILLLGNIQYL